MANKSHHRHLIPAKPGEVRNPKGHNQYTYRREAEAAFDKLLRSWAADGSKRTRAEAIIEKAMELAEAGKPYALDQILKRILPAVEKHEHSIAGVSDESLFDRLAALRRAKRANGHALEPDEPGEGFPQ